MTNILVTDFVTGLFIFLRMTGFFFSAPIFSNNAIPIVMKLTLSLVISYIIFFTVGKYNYTYDMGLFVLIFLGFKEVLTGILIGFFITFVFEGISYAGLMIGFDMGLSMSEAFDISTESSSNVVGQILNVFVLMVFFIINGHHYLIQALSASFKIIPMGHYTINENVINILIKYSSSIFIIAVKIAAPIMVSFFLLHLAAGIISRVSPQINIFFVLQPLHLGMGFALLMAFVPVYIYFIKELLRSYESSLLELINAMAR